MRTIHYIMNVNRLHFFNISILYTYIVVTVRDFSCELSKTITYNIFHIIHKYIDLQHRSCKMTVQLHDPEKPSVKALPNISTIQKPSVKDLPNITTIQKPSVKDLQNITTIQNLSVKDSPNITTTRNAGMYNS